MMLGDEDKSCINNEFLNLLELYLRLRTTEIHLFYGGSLSWNPQ